MSILKHIEPTARELFPQGEQVERALQASIAISLKRLADASERRNEIASAAVLADAEGEPSRRRK
jgi:hypothetical protein